MSMINLHGFLSLFDQIDCEFSLVDKVDLIFK